MSEIVRTCNRRSDRDVLAHEVLKNETFYLLLFELIQDTTNKSSERAAWVLELVSLQKTEWLFKYKEHFIDLVPKISLDSVIRPFSKLCAVTTEQHVKADESLFTHAEIEVLISSCFDWLIDPKLKVAPKVHAMQTLFNLRNHEAWVSSELLHILEANVNNGSPGYKSRAKKLITTLKKEIVL